MNKKFYLGMFAAAAMLFATSCSSDDLYNEASSTGMMNATFTVQTPQGIGTRAVSDGQTVDAVACAVYDEKGEELTRLRQNTVPMDKGVATYSVSLAKGQSYRVAFFAYKKDVNVYDVADLKAVKVNTEGQFSNDENRDAFTAFVDIDEATTQNNVDLTVTLKRPFAQLNIGTADTEAAANAGIKIAKTQVVVKDVYTTFSAFDNAVPANAETSEINFALANIPTDPTTLTAENKTYDYLAFNYLLVGEKSITDVTFSYEAEDGNTNVTEYANVPLQRNYRTNIVGNLLTSNADFTIVVDKEYATPDETIGAPTEVTPDENGVYNVSKASELLWIAKQVNDFNNTFAGKTVKLTDDIYLSNMDWTPMGNVNSYPSKTFAGTFDGNGKTIHDLNVSKDQAAGLFGSLTGVVTNLTVDGAKIVSNHWAGVICGYSSNGSTRIETCHVKNATVTLSTEWNKDEKKYDNGDKAGGIIGYMAAGDVVTECTVENTTITAYRDLGGIVGYGRGTVENCEVLDGVTVTVDASHNYNDHKTPEEYSAGSIVGDFDATTTITNCSGEATLNVPAAVAVVSTAAELADKLNDFGAAGAGNNTINITNDIILTDAWTPVVINGYNGAGVVTINGNGHSISGLTAPLLAGGFAGNSGVIIKDLTIDASTIVSTNELGSGAFIETIDSQPTITLDNCHVKNSSITGSRTGGLIGWNSGYNNENNGAVKTYVTITNCSVENCEITGAGTVGGIVGHAGANAWTYNTIEDCKVINCKLTSNDDSYRVGGIVGTANIGEVIINRCSVDAATTMTQNNNGTIIERPEGQSNLYGRFVPDTTGKLTIDGVSISK